MKKIFFLLILPIAGRGQTGIEILKQCEDSIKLLKNITYNIYDENPSQKTTADVTIQRDSLLPIFDARYKIVGIVMSDNGSTSISLSYNGKSFEFVDIKTKELVRLDSASYRKIGRTGMMPHTLLAVAPYCQKEPFGPMMKQLVSAQRFVDTAIFNIPCYSVNVTIEVNSDVMGKQLTSSTWYIDKEKYFIRGHKSEYGQYFIAIKNTNEEMKPGFFNLTVATEVKKITGLEPLGEGLLQIGTKAPDWSLITAENKTITLKSLKGKVVLLDFWGTWCVPCLRAMPEIQAIHEYFKNDAVEIIGVSVETEKKADPAGYAKKKGYTYTILLNGKTITKDYKVVEFPSVYLIDRNGNIIHAEHSGNRENFKEDLIKRIETALK